MVLDELNVLISADVSKLEAGILRGLSGLANLGKAAITAAGDMQALEKGFAAVYTGSGDVADELKKVQEVAKLPGLGLKEAIQGSVRLQAVGVSAEQARKTLLAFGNAIATTGGGKSELDRVTTQLGQLSAKGKVLSQDLRPVIEAAPAAAQALKRLYGTVDPEIISKALEKAGKSSTDFIAQLTDELAKLPKVTGGINNAFENLDDASTKALAKLGTSFNNAFNIEGGINLVGEAIDRLGDSFVNLEPALRAVAAYFGPSGEGGYLFGQLADSVRNAAREIRGAFDALEGGRNAGGFIKDLIGDIVIGFTAAADVIGGVIGTITRALKGDFAGAEVQAQRALSGLTAPIRNALGLTQQLHGTFDAAFKQFDYFADEVEKPVAPLTAIKNLAADTTKELEKQLKAQQKLDKGYTQLAARSTKGLAPKSAPEFIEVLTRPSGGPLDSANGRDPLNLPKRLSIKLGPIDYAEMQKSLDAAVAYVTDSYARIDDVQRAALQRQTEFNKNIEDAFDQLSVSIGPLVGGLAGQLGDAFGAIVTGAASAGDALAGAFGGIIAAIGDFMGQFGQQLIAIGIGKVALDTLFTAPGTGPLAIAAGAGLVLLAGVAKSVGSSARNSLGSLSSGGSSNRGVGSYLPASGIASQPQRLKVEVVGTFKAAGQDLRAVLNAGEYRAYRTN